MSTRIQPFVLAAMLLFAFLVSSKCQAEPRARDGFYVQLTTGFSLPHFAITADNSNGSSLDHYVDSEHGLATGGSLLLGVPLRPGLVLGLGGIFTLFSTDHPEPTKNGQTYGQVDVKQPLFQSLSMVGPFVDFYPSSALGWHAQALVGYARIGYAEITANPFFDADPSGIGLMVGVGDDWWISEHWSVGLLARVTYANMQLATTPFSDGIGTTSEHNTMVSPSFDVSFTAH